MRILHISTRLILGGSQENTVLSCEGQARRGHDVHLAYGPIYGPEGSLLERVQKFRTADGRGIITHEVPSLIREIDIRQDRACRAALETLIADLRPDIVHTHSSKAGILGRVAARNTRAATPPALRPGVVHTIHGPPFMPVEGSALARAKTRLKNWVYARAERYAAHRCHVMVSVADAMTRQFLERGIGRPEQYVTVRSGMETARFLLAAAGESRREMRGRLGIAPEDFVVGTVARLAEHKGHDDLLDALGQDMCQDPTLRLLWVGDGWFRERLIKVAHAMGLSVGELDIAALCTRGLSIPPSRCQIMLAGLVPPERIPGLIRAMDVLAHPSYREGLPRTVLQAQLCGVCPVAYDCDGTGEVCRDMQTGRLVPTGDIRRLRDAILWSKAHPREREDMAARGRDEFETLYSAEHMVDELEKVYARALAAARPR